MGFTITSHATGRGVCALTGREADGLTVTFADGTLQKTFLSWKSLKQLASLKFGQTGAGDVSTATTAALASDKK